MRRYGKRMEEQLQLHSLSAAIGLAATQNTSLRERLDACCTLLVSHLDIAFARIWVMQDDERFLELQASAGIYTRIDGTSRLKQVGHGNKIGHIAFSKRPYISNQLIGDPQIIDQEWVKREKMAAFAGHPLIIGGKVLGVLAMFSRAPISQMVIKVMASIADFIALAIDNVKAVQRLQQSHERYRNLIENISDWIWMVDNNLVYTYSSPQVGRILGYDAHEIIGKTPFDFMPETEAKQATKLLHDISAGQQPFIGLENINLHRDGHKVILETSGAPIFDGQGQFKGYRCIGHDVTAKKEAEDMLVSQKKMLEAIFNAVPDAMIFVTPDHAILKTNHGFFKLFGYADGEIHHQRISVISNYVEEFARQGVVNHHIPHQNLPFPGEIEYRRKDGTIFPGETVGAEINNADGEVAGFIILIRDISERKQNELSLRQAQKMEALGTLSGGIAHDFNNLLNAIKGYATLAIDDLAPASLTAKNLRQVVMASERASALVQQILAFSRGIREEMKPLYLHQIAKELVTLMAGTLPATIKIKQSFDSKCRVVLADASQIYQVLMNLYTNACHAMRETGGILEVRLGEEEITRDEIPGLPAGAYAKLIVSDTGHGMDQEVMSRIFEPYFTTKKMGEGSGLGLATVHGIIKSHGGHITVDSEIGIGSRFIIYLPIIDQPAAPGVKKSRDKKKTREQIQANILFVDDLDFNVHLGVLLLSRMGCRVTGETDSTRALTLFTADPQRFDMVITDQTMPKLAGIEMAREMLAIRPDLPIIMVSGYSDTVTADKAKTVGIRDFMQKPLAFEQLFSIIKNILPQKAGGSIPDTPATTEVLHRRSTDQEKVPVSLEAVKEYLFKTYEMSPESLDSMMKGLRETLQSELDKARVATSQNELKMLAMSAHTIKGILLNVGLAAWADLAKVIEMAAKNGEVKDYGIILGELGQGVAALLQDDGGGVQNSATI